MEEEQEVPLNMKNSLVSDLDIYKDIILDEKVDTLSGDLSP